MDSTARSAALKQAMISGGCTFVVCAILFTFMVKTDMNTYGVSLDMVLTSGVTALICSVLQTVISSKTKGQQVSAMGDMKLQAAYVLIPESRVAFVVIITLVTTFAVGFGFGSLGALVTFAPGVDVPRFAYVAIKALVAGVSSAYPTYHATVFVSGLCQRGRK